jgi:prepilin-type N-terminal cleavage/methylation domain-containing protein
MKLSQINNKKGFTLSEMMIATAISSVTLAATLIASVSLQKSFSAVDNYFATQIQQIRIVDYLSRDVKCSYIVTSTSSPQTVTCTIPNYIQADGTRSNPTLATNGNGGTIVDYGKTAYNERTVSDVVTTSGSATLTSPPPGDFTSSDVGKSIAGTGIPPGTTIQSYVSATNVTLSSNATTTAAGVEAVVGASTVVYSISGQAIQRTANGVLTTIASSTDNLIPSWLDVDLANTEYLTTNITFLPIFTSAGVTAERSGTTIYSTTYLRNKRRG